MNTCDCPNPPGGRVTCPPDHLAICRVDENSGVRSQCIRIPEGFERAGGDSIVTWLLARITNREHKNKSISNADVSMLLRGKYIDDMQKVSFSLPDHIEKFLGDSGFEGME